MVSGLVAAFCLLTCRNRDFQQLNGRNVGVNVAMVAVVKVPMISRWEEISHLLHSSLGEILPGPVSPPSFLSYPRQTCDLHRGLLSLRFWSKSTDYISSI